MILYFSATGNCKYVAGRLAEAAFRSSLSSRICKNGSAEKSAEPLSFRQHRTIRRCCLYFFAYL